MKAKRQEAGGLTEEKSRPGSYTYLAVYWVHINKTVVNPTFMKVLVFSFYLICFREFFILCCW